MSISSKTTFVNQYPGGTSDVRARINQLESHTSNKVGADPKNQNILLQKSESRVKQLEYEVLVMKDAADIRTQQIRDSNDNVALLNGQLKKEKAKTAPIQMGDTGINRILHFSQRKLEQQQQECDVNEDEIVELRQELKTCEKHILNLEEGKEIRLSKITELLNLLQTQCPSDVQWQLQSKTLEISELAAEFQVLGKRFEKSQERVLKMEQERDMNNKMVIKLSEILSADIDANKVKDIISALKGGKQLSTEQAQVLTIQNLKSRVESLEEEKETMTSEITRLHAENRGTELLKTYESVSVRPNPIKSFWGVRNR